LVDAPTNFLFWRGLFLPPFLPPSAAGVSDGRSSAVQDDGGGGGDVPMVVALVMTFAAMVAQRHRRTNSGYFSRTVTLAQLLLSLRDPVDFKSMYRLEFVELEQLHADMCRSDPSYLGDPRRTRNVDSKIQLLSTLRFVAGGDPKDVAKSHGQSKASFWRHLRQTLKSPLCHLCCPWTIQPSLRNLKGVVAVDEALDGAHTAAASGG